MALNFEGPFTEKQKCTILSGLPRGIEQDIKAVRGGVFIPIGNSEKDYVISAGRGIGNIQAILDRTYIHPEYSNPQFLYNILKNLLNEN